MIVGDLTGGGMAPKVPASRDHPFLPERLLRACRGWRPRRLNECARHRYQSGWQRQDVRPPVSISAGAPLRSISAASTSSGSVRVTAMMKRATATLPTTGSLVASALPPPSPCSTTSLAERNELGHVAAARRLGEASQQRAMALAINGETRPLLKDARSGAAENLAAGDGVAPNHRHDLFEREIERVTQHEYNSLER